MKPAAIIGVILIVLGIGSLFYGIPSREKHGVNVGRADIVKVAERYLAGPPRDALIEDIEALVEEARKAT